jgi:hypothetical protein
MLNGASSIFVTGLRGCLLLFSLAGFPSVAHAQWYVAGYFGANHTAPADVVIDSPATGVTLTLQDVEFAARPFDSPQYYGYRIGKLFGADRRIGVEIEFIHLKVIGDTSREYVATGRAGGTTFAGTPLRMSDAVQEFQMTHGLNFVVLNLVARRPLGGADGPLAIVARAGLGPTIPHAESRLGGVEQQQYEFGGLGAHAAAGLDLRIRHRLSAVFEYKFTFARPEIGVTGGSGRTSAATHQLGFGLAFGLSR